MNEIYHARKNPGIVHPAMAVIRTIAGRNARPELEEYLPRLKRHGFTGGFISGTYGFWR